MHVMTSRWDPPLLFLLIVLSSEISSRRLLGEMGWMIELWMRRDIHGEIKYSLNLQSWFDESLKTNSGLEGLLKGMKVVILKEGMHEPSVHPEMRRKVYESAS
jgi:hypothetical protein